MLIKSFVALIAASLGLLCPQDSCPDQVTKTTKTKIIYGDDLGCGGVKINLGTRSFNTGAKGCPAFILIIPPYDKTEHRKGSKTYTRPIGRVSITRLEFSCALDWFLIVPFGSSCRQISSSTFAGPTTYAQYPCLTLDAVGVGD